jgi:hypothetical protein
MSMYAVLCASSFLMAQVCPVIRVDGVSAEALGCVRETLPRHGMILEEGDAAAITGPRGAKGSFNWDAGHRVLAVTITGLPFLASCQRAAAEILDFGRGCAGTDAVTRVGDNTWRIDSPNVRKRESAYPTIRLLSGDTVRVLAGGCVQTGGHGDTWKLYVDPPKDPIHHGTIKLPGQAAFIRLKDIPAGDSYVIPAAGNDLPVRLGYEDNDYSENGYWGRDPGPNGQCRNQTNAWVQILVEHAAK